MPRNITRDDLVEARMNQMHGATAITAAALVQGLMAFADADMQGMTLTTEAASDCLKERIGTTGDRWYGGCLLLAMAMAEVVDDLCAFEDGVFTYEHIEVMHHIPYSFPPANNLPAYLMQVVEPLAWYDLSENWKKPSRECLEQVFKEWAEQAGVPVKERDHGRV